MADCIQSKIITEVGTVLSGITTANGYSVTVATVAYDSVNHIKRKNADYPLIEFFMVDADFTEADNEMHEAGATINVLGYLRRSDSYDDTLASRKLQHEFAADVRTAINSIYTRQQSGTFVLDNFNLNRNIKQDYFTMSNLAGVFTQFDVAYDINFTER